MDSLSLPFICPSFMNSKHDPFEPLKTKTMEEGDFLLYCPAKTGQHWTWEIMSMLVAGKAEYIYSGKVGSWIDVNKLENVYSRFSRPRVLCTHLSLSRIPDNFR